MSEAKCVLDENVFFFFFQILLLIEAICPML